MNKTRDYSFDILRIMAIMAVITIHVSSPVALHDTALGSYGWWVGHTFDAVSRWAVPVFVMISGALLIKPGPFKSPGPFYRRRLSRVLGALALWVPIYLGADVVVRHGVVPWRIWLDDLLHGNPTPGHLYFIFVIAGLYFIAPYLNALLAGLNRRQRTGLMLGVMAASSAWATLEFYFSGGKPLDFFSQWVPYVGYFLLGHIIVAREWSKRLKPRHFAGAILGSLIVMLTATRWLMAPHAGHLGHMGQLFYDYLNPVVIVLSASVFMGVQRLWAWAQPQLELLRRPRVLSGLSYLSALTFGVYLCHYLFILPLSRLDKTFIHGHPTLGIVGEIVVTAALSFLATALWGQLARAGKWAWRRSKLKERSWQSEPAERPGKRSGERRFNYD